MITPIKSQTVNGVEWAITFDDSTGQFKAEADGYSPIRTDTYMALAPRMKDKTRRAAAKVEVPYMRVAASARTGSYRVIRGVATGIHSGNGNVIFNEGKGAEQLTRSSSEHLKPMTPDDEKHYLELLTRIKQLRQEAFELSERYSFGFSGLRGAVEAAIADAAKGE